MYTYIHLLTCTSEGHKICACACMYVFSLFVEVLTDMYMLCVYVYVHLAEIAGLGQDRLCPTLHCSKPSLLLLGGTDGSVHGGLQLVYV